MRNSHGPNPAGRVELVQPLVNPQERFLRQVAGDLPVVNEPADDPHQPPLVPQHQITEGVLIAAPGRFDQTGVGGPSFGRSVGVLRVLGEQVGVLRIGHEHSHAPLLRRAGRDCWAFGRKHVGEGA